MPDVSCFKQMHAMRCACAKEGKPHSGCPVTIERILEQAASGGATCPTCSERVDLRTGMWFQAFGNLEALFGLEPRRLLREIPATTHAAVLNLDAADGENTDWGVAYAVVSPGTTGGDISIDEIPWLLAPQSMHQPWHSYMRLYVPPGPERFVAISFVLRPPVLPHPIELAVQACDSFHRGRLGVACVLLGAAIESCLRGALEAAYAARGVAMPSRAGMGELLERVRMILEPPLGTQLVGHIQALAREGRNPAAHGRVSELTRDEVARWMVDAATVYEWSRVARYVAPPPAP